MAYASEKKFVKNIGVYLVGGVVGVLAEKLVSDAISAGQLPNPQFATVTLSDAAMVTAELGTAYYLKKKPTKKKGIASRFLIGMATGTVAGQAYAWGAQQGSWVGLQRAGATAGMGNGAMLNGGQGKYGRVAPVPNNGYLGAYLKPIGWAHPRR